MYIKNITKIKTCQQEKNLDFQKHLEQTIKSLSKTARMVLNLLISWSSRYKNLWPSQSSIARIIGCTRQTVNEICQLLKEHNLITMISHHRTSSSYKISQAFHNPFIRSHLMSFLPALKSLTIYLILSFSSAKPDTIINIENIYYINNLETKTENRLTTKNIDGANKIAQLFQNDLRRKVPSQLQALPILYGQDPKNGYAVIEKSHKEGRQRFQNWQKFSASSASDNAYYATSGRSKNLYYSSKFHSSIHTVTNINRSQGPRHISSIIANIKGFEAMNRDDEAQPKFNTPDKHRSNVSAYKTWVPEVRPNFDPFEEAKKLSALRETEDYRKFAQLVGEEVAFQLFKNTIANAVDDYRKDLDEPV